MQSQLNETELIHLTSNGDRKAFSLLYSTYLNNIYRYVFSICYDKVTSEEIVQELFLKLWEGRQDLTKVVSIKPYLYKSAKNLLLNYIKKGEVEAKVMSVIKTNAQTERNTTDDEIVFDEYYKITQNAIGLLPEKRKQIFKLRLDDDMSLDDIAATLSISKSVVKKQLYKGVGFVRKYLYKHGEIVILLLGLFGVIKKS